MATVLQLSKLKSVSLVITLLVIVIVLPASCSRKVGFATSTVVPAADGKVKVKKDNNNNYAVDVTVKHLAEPNRLPQPKDVYVVWIETERNGVQNLGQLATSSGFLSSTLKAELKAVTPYKPSRVFITGEDAATVNYPGSYVVLNTSDF